MATTGELYLAWQDGMDVCDASWLADQTARYPISIAKPQCGGGEVGIMTMDLDPNTDSHYSALCFQGKYIRLSEGLLYNSHNTPHYIKLGWNYV